MEQDTTLISPAAKLVTNGQVIAKPALIASEHEPLSNLIANEALRKRSRRIWNWIIAAVVVIIAVATWFALKPKPLPIALRFRTGVVSTGGIIREVKATGDVEAVTTVQVGAEVSGRIAQVPVDFNSIVHAGQVLARIDPTLYKADLDQSAGQLASTQASLAQAISNRDHISRDLARARQLYEQRLISVSDLDTDTSNLRVANETVSAASAALLTSRGAWEAARTNLQYCTIRSQINGIVVTRNIDSGQTIASVFQTPVLFAVAADLKQMQVVAAVDEADIGEVKEGQQATFTVNAYPNRVFKGTVTQVRNSPTIVEDVVTYGVVISVDNSDLALKPGMTATSSIVTAISTHPLKVPNGAFHFTPPGEKVDSASGVWALDQNSFRRVPLTPGITDGEWTEIDYGSIPEGATVLLELTPEGRTAYGK